MKLLKGVALLQLALLCALSWRVLQLESSLTSVHARAVPSASVAPVAYPSTEPSRPDEASAEPTAVAAADRSAGDERLRTMIRQALRSELNAFMAATDPPGETFAGIDLERELALDARRDSVEERLDRYEAIGWLGPAEMGALQQEIASLRPADRRAALARLNRAINAGTIEARL